MSTERSDDALHVTLDEIHTSQSVAATSVVLQVKLVEEARVSEVLGATEGYRNFLAVTLGLAAAASAAGISLESGVKQPFGLWITLSVSSALTFACGIFAFRERKRRGVAKAELAKATIIAPAQLNFMAPNTTATVTSSPR